ncbi:hypothetical protein [Acidovorax sp. SUPP3334]|uniref:hypothetical protein n=1 Tax=Acidovorax sp. SUPP3334 TaxID=2920881 RepID=UPI0023DE2FC3|nr:hypothetical protein [Acidovorax sp. SUPP3334]GKT21694.1 hypothetical protein AVHM3334_05685 [Acidovorax sp. SUPP3334]
MKDSTDLVTKDLLSAPAKRGRKAAPVAVPVVVETDLAPVAQAVAAADQASAMQAAYGQERDLLNQLLGQAQMADAFSKFSLTVRTSKLAFVKENKLYRSLKGQKSPDGQEFSKGTWEDFCRLLGRSVAQVDEDITNLNTLGEEALDSMSRMGIGYRELRQYRRLPEDQKQALIEVAKAGDKEGFVELAEEIIARHAKEKEALEAKVGEAGTQLAAKDRVLADNAAKMTEQAQALELARGEKFTPPPGSVARTKAEQTLLSSITLSTSRAYLRMHAVFTAADAALSDSGGNAPEAIQQVARQSIEFLAQQLADMAQEFGISVDLEARIRPDWLDEAALAVLEARNSTAQ